MRINHNMSAIFANRQLQLVASQADKTIERLASGQAINRAGDDASGLAVSEKMRTQINGLFQAEKNAQNGLSFIQVAEGSLSQINDILQRIRMLSVQSANGIYSNDDRQAGTGRGLIANRRSRPDCDICRVQQDENAYRYFCSFEQNR